MKTNHLKQFAAMRANLERERAEIQQRLNELKEALGEGNGAVSTQPLPASEAAPGRRQMSAAARAKIAAAQRARWAQRKKGESAPQATPARKGKKTMSAEARARIAESQRKRWAAIRAAKAK